MGSRYSVGADSSRRGSSLIAGEMTNSEKVSPRIYTSSLPSRRTSKLRNEEGGRNHHFSFLAAPLSLAKPSFALLHQFSLPSSSMQDLEDAGPEADDYLHDPDAKTYARVRLNRPSPLLFLDGRSTSHRSLVAHFPSLLLFQGSIFTWRGLMNLGCLAMLISALLMLL